MHSLLSPILHRCGRHDGPITRCIAILYPAEAMAMSQDIQLSGGPICRAVGCRCAMYDRGELGFVPTSASVRGCIGMSCFSSSTQASWLMCSTTSLACLQEYRPHRIYQPTPLQELCVNALLTQNHSKQGPWTAMHGFVLRNTTEDSSGSSMQSLGDGREGLSDVTAVIPKVIT